MLQLLIMKLNETSPFLSLLSNQLAVHYAC